jgi:cell division protein FtsN
MLFGLTLGLAVAVGVYLSGAKPRADAPLSASKPSRPASPSGSVPKDRRPAQASRDDAQRPAAALGTGGGSSAPAKSARTGEAKAAARGTGGTEFDFYKILPNYEVAVPQADPGKAPALPAPSPPVDTPGQYLLQAGSFRSFGEADRLKASLALLGIESQIEKARVGDDEYHRVQIGPIADLDKLNQLRNQLRKAGIDALVMRAND